MLLSGTRGSGKTVLLASIAGDEGELPIGQLVNSYFGVLLVMPSAAPAL